MIIPFSSTLSQELKIIHFSSTESQKLMVIHFSLELMNFHLVLYIYFARRAYD